jgi:hypothetical protein
MMGRHIYNCFRPSITQKQQNRTMIENFNQDASTGQLDEGLPFGLDVRLETMQKRLMGEMNPIERRMAIMEDRGGIIPLFADGSPLDGVDLTSAQSADGLPRNVTVKTDNAPQEALDIARERADEFKRVTVRETEGQQTSPRMADVEPKVIVEGHKHQSGAAIKLFKQETGEDPPDDLSHQNGRRGTTNPGSSPSGPPSMSEARDRK